MGKIRVRFAPSPTGPLHIGGARSALFNYLYAKNTGGRLILRIEDTDLERSSRESEENILASLKWLGLEWDEGPDVGGDYGPYRQTERLDIYKKYIERLLAEGKAYYCYCSEEELEFERQECLSRNEVPKYSGKCRNLTPEERKKLEDEGRKPVVRFCVPSSREILIPDKVRGDVVFDSDGIGDFVIVKSDGIPTYNFAVVVDDFTMEITHVIRAEEHLSNTPRQILIYEALGITIPEFAHISLILGSDRSKMSKRHGATSVVQYKEEGYLPEAVVNFLALLGWSPVGEEEVFSLEETAEQFSLARVAKNPAVFDMDKLRWLNGVYIRNCPLPRLAEMALPYMQKGGFISSEPTQDELAWLSLVVTALQEKLTTVGDIIGFMSLFTGDDVVIDGEEELELLKEDTFLPMATAFCENLSALEELNPVAVKTLLKGLTKELGLKGKQVYMPLRVALTGKKHGPELDYLISILGKETSKKRLSRTAEQAGLKITLT